MRSQDGSLLSLVGFRLYDSKLCRGDQFLKRRRLIIRSKSLILIAVRVGGVVSETSFKFFILFVAWTAVYCFFNLAVAAYFLAEYRRKVR